MQSLASLMSFNQSDVGNLEDFYDSDEEPGQERRSSPGHGHAPAAGNFQLGTGLESAWIQPGSSLVFQTETSLESAWCSSLEPAWNQPGSSLEVQVWKAEPADSCLPLLFPVFLSWVKPGLPPS